MPTSGASESMDDHDALVAAVRAGVPGAFEALVAAVERPLRACVAAHASAAHQIDEEVQDTLVLAYERIDQSRGGGTPCPGQGDRTQPPRQRVAHPAASGRRIDEPRADDRRRRRCSCCRGRRGSAPRQSVR